MGAGVTFVENFVINDLDNFNGGHTVNFTIDAGYASLLTTIDASSLDNDEPFRFNAANNLATELVNVTGGDAYDYFAMGDNFNGGDTVNGGPGDNLLSAITVTDGDFAHTSNIARYVLAGGAGDSAFLGGNAQNASITQVVDNVGNDTINASGYTVSLTVYAVNGGNDSITTGSGADYIVDNAGDDTINSGAFNDTVLAGPGNDSVTAGEGNDSVDGLAGNDTVSGGNGDDTIVGYASQVDGNDVLNGNAGNDTLQLSDGQGNVNATINLPNFLGIENVTAVDTDSGLGQCLQRLQHCLRQRQCRHRDAHQRGWRRHQWPGIVLRCGRRRRAQCRPQ